jgi:hypothetical protein
MVPNNPEYSQIFQMNPQYFPSGLFGGDPTHCMCDENKVAKRP